MKKSTVLSLLVILFAQLPQRLAAQERKDTLVIVETTDGNRYVGSIASQDDQQIRLKTATIGEITIPRAIIHSISPVKQSEMRGQEYWFENPYAITRYFFNPSGYGLPAGEGYYQNTWVLVNGASIGITDNVSIGLGTVPFFLFALGTGDASTPVWVTPKVSIPVSKDKVNLGLGALYLTLLGEDSSGGGIVYGVSTFGPKEENLSVGLGWGFTTEDGFGDKPTLSLSYIRRGKPKWAFLTENYFISAGNGAVFIFSGGARHIGKKVSIDFGAFTFLYTGGQDVFPILPWLSISVPFDVKK